MSRDARSKERKRLKREKKKAAHRRAMNISPYKRIGTLGELQACYINSNWQEQGLASIHVVRQNPAGGFAMAVFLIDVWCAGLKDGYARVDLLSDDVEHSLKRARENFAITRIDPQVARGLVASGIRFARQNGFKLPAHLDRWLHLLGDVPDPASADLSGFGKDGGLMWVGSIEDLHRRLIGCSVEEFLARPDVHYLMGDTGMGNDAEEEAGPDTDSYIDWIKSSADELAAQTSQWLRSRGREPSPMLQQGAVAATCHTLLQDLKADSGETDFDWDSDDRDAISEAVEDCLREVLGPPEDPNIPDELRKALQQVAEYSNSEELNEITSENANG